MTGRELLFLMIGVLISNVVHVRARTGWEKPAPDRDGERSNASRTHVGSYPFFGWAALLA